MAWWKTKRATHVVHDPNGLSVCMYHDTPVVTWSKKAVVLMLGSCELHDSMTTRRRMNEVAKAYDLPYRVFREKGETFVWLRTKHKCEAKRRQRLSFTDYVASFQIPQRKPTNCPDCALKLLADA